MTQQPPIRHGHNLLRSLDFYLGVPACAVLGMLRHRHPRLQCPPERIGVIVVGAIGDALLASTVLDALRRTYPRAKIILLLSEANQGVGCLLGCVDEVKILQILKPWVAATELRALGIELLVDASQWFRVSSLISALSGCTYKVGFKTRGQFRHFVFDAVEIHSSQRHEVENYRGLARCAGAVVTGMPALKPAELFPAERYGIKGRYIVMHPWPSGYKSYLREWPRQYWCSLMEEIVRREVNVVLTGSRDDVQSVDALLWDCGLGGHAVSVAGRLSLSDLRDCLAAAVGVVSVNTGVMHLASLLDVPTVSLNGPTSVARWGGTGCKTINLSVSKENGGAFLNLGFEYPRSAVNVMGKISPQQVVSALEKLGALPTAGVIAGHGL